MPKRKKIVDVPEPEERTIDTEGRKAFRYQLSAPERERIKEVMAAKKVADALMNVVIQPGFMDGIAKDIGVSKEQMADYVSQSEDDGMRSAYSYAAASMCLDLERPWGRHDMAAELGMTKWQVDRLMATDVFKRVWEKMYHDITADPTPHAVAAGITQELLPLAYQTLRDVLGRSDSVGLKAATLVFQLAGVQPARPVQSDREQGIDFLLKKGISIDVKSLTVNNYSVPEEYRKVLETIPEVVDAEVVSTE